MRRLVLAVAAVLVALPAVGRAAPPPPPDFPAPDPQVMQLHREIAALKLDRLLNLTPEQARSLLPIVRQAEQMRTQMLAAHAQNKAALIRALTAVRDDLRRTGAVSPESQKALEAARPAPNEQMRTTARGLREQAHKVLTSDQVEKLRAFDARPLAGPGPGPGPGVGGLEDDDGEMGPPPGAAGHHGPAGHGRAHHGATMHILLSPEFQQLLEARAR